MFKCDKSATAVRLSMIPTIFVGVLAANQSAQTNAMKAPLNAPPAIAATASQTSTATAPVNTLVISQPAASAELRPKASLETHYQQQLEKLPAAKLDIDTRARHFILLDAPIWLNQKIRGFMQEAK